MFIRTALDSEDLSVFTSNTDFIFTYSDLVPDRTVFEARYPHQQVVYIDRGLGDPDLKATIADVEPHALTPADLPKWWDDRHNRGAHWLTHYSDRNDRLACVDALAGRPAYQWVATLDGTVHVDGFTPLGGPDIVQILGSAHLGFNADFSLVLNPAWRPSPNAVTKASLMTSVGMAANLAEEIHGELVSLESALRQLP